MAGAFGCLLALAWLATAIALAMLAPTMRKTRLKIMQRGRRLLPGRSLALAGLANVVTLCEANGSLAPLRRYLAHS
jgi:hypothetical protein